MVAVVTGSASGIGSAIAARLAQEMPVAIWDKNLNSAEAYAEVLREGGHSATAIAVDVCERTSVETAMEATRAALGAPTVLVNNAGIREIEPFLDLSVAVWDQVFSVNLDGAFHCTQIMARQLVERKSPGSIVNVSSVAGLGGLASRAAYCASKHGLVGLTKAAAIDLAVYGIRVNAVAPGFIRTPLTEPYESDPKMLTVVRNSTPLRRWGAAGEIAEVVAFLSSDRASFVTGTIVPIDGGMMAGPVLPIG